MSMILHPAVALSADGHGFVPAIKVADANGNHLNVYQPRGGAAEFRTFTRQPAALAEAWVIARRVAAARPEHFSV